MSMYSQANYNAIGGLVIEGDSDTQQQFQLECDVNTIMNTYVQTGEWSSAENVTAREGVFWDLSSVADEYQGYLDQINGANEEFMKLPGDIRQRFNNDPQELITWLDAPANLEEAVALGIVTADYPGFAG